MVKQYVFKDFSEWWHYARILTDHQKSIIFDNISESQKDFLEGSYNREGWEEVFCHNEIDSIIDDLKEKYEYDVLSIRSKVLKGKSVYLPRKFWDLLQEHLNQFKTRHVKYILSGIKAIPCKENNNVVLLISSSNAQNTQD